MEVLYKYIHRCHICKCQICQYLCWLFWFFFLVQIKKHDQHYFLIWIVKCFWIFCRCFPSTDVIKVVTVRKRSRDWNRRIESHCNSESDAISTHTHTNTMLHTLRDNSRKTVITNNTGKYLLIQTHTWEQI